MSILEFITNIKASEYAAGLVGIFIGWAIKHFKDIWEIKKLELEVDKLKVELVDSLNQTDEDRRTIGKDVIKIMALLLKETKSENTEQIKKVRDDLREIYFLDYLGIFNRYLDKGKLIKKGDESLFIKEDILPFLELSKNVINTLNYEIFTEKMGYDKVSLRKEDIAFAFSYAINNLKKNSFKERRELKELAKFFDLNLDELKKKKWYQIK